VAALGLVAAVGTSAIEARVPRTSTGPAGGLQGTLFQGPLQPVCRQNESCEGPAPGVRLTFTAERRSIPPAHVTTKSDGSYRILLTAGVYAVRTDRRVFGRVPFPARVKVRLGHVDHLDFRIDTGIR
jgi:hypothetical protein